MILISSNSSAVDLADNLMHDWANRAARGECGWICPDCCCTFPEGMPNECEHGYQTCTDIIRRDKRIAERK